MSLYLGENCISAGGSSAFRNNNIGEIIQSTIPLSDAGLHLLDGSLISGAGSYSAFVTYIAGLVSSYPDLFETEANWQQSVMDYGVCGKFVYDNVNNTVRLPKYSNKIYSSSISATAPVVGNGMTLGLTNGSKVGAIYENASNAFSSNDNLYGATVGTSFSGTAGYFDNSTGIGITTDSTKSGIITDLSNITTPVDGYYYIVVATSTKTDIEVDIDEIATDLNGKADVDLTNVNNSGKDFIATQASPSPKYDALTLGASGATYIAPANGWFCLYKASNAADQYASFRCNNRYSRAFSPVNATSAELLFQAKKGEVVSLIYTLGGTLTAFNFIYAEGDNV